MDGELKKTSVRANRLEKKRFEMMLSNFDSAKKNVVMEMKRSQVDINKQLKRYKDRQREILFTRSETSSSNEDMLKQISRPLSQTKSGSLRRQTLTSSSLPSSFQAIPRDDLTEAGTIDLGTAADGDNTSTSITVITAASGSTLGSVTLLPPPPQTDNDRDLGLLHTYHLHHQQKSKADLRPHMACSLTYGSNNASPFGSSSVFAPSTTSTIKLLQVNGGRLGTPTRQVRYLDEEEIEQRCSFHRLLLDTYRSLENQRLERINDLVGEFCGKSSSSSSVAGSRLVTSCPPLFEEGVMSLPPGVPASVHRAMRVKMFPLNSLQQRSNENTSMVPRPQNK
ncbi:hypothetical protein ACOMHN_027022 [Nucella lapillus]